MKRRLLVTLILVLMVGCAALIPKASAHETRQETRDYVTAFDFSASADKYATAHSLDWAVRIWDASSNQLLHTIQVPDYRRGEFSGPADIQKIVFSPSGDRLAIAPFGDMQGLILVVDSSSGETLLEISPPPVYAIDWSPDGKYLAGEYDYDPMTHPESFGCFDWTIALWDAETGDELKQSKCGGGSLDWHPSDDKVIFPDSSRGVVVWDVKSWQKMYTFRVNGAVSAAWSPSGDTLAAVNVYGVVRIWDAHTHELLRRIRMRVFEHDYPRVFWGPDGKVIGVFTFNRIQLWDVNTGELIFFAEVREIIEGAALRPDGRIIAASSIDGVVTLETPLSQTPGQ